MSKMIPRTPPLANPPPDFNGFRSWTIQALSNVYIILAKRLEEITLQDTFANRPTANGRQRFFYATDTDALYYDSGAWEGPL